jgi:putative ABC transport system permease protein
MRDWLSEFESRIAIGPAPFVIAGFLALAIAVVTIAGHAARVARANPVNALRYTHTHDVDLKSSLCGT